MTFSDYHSSQDALIEINNQRKCVLTPHAHRCGRRMTSKLTFFATL